MEALDTTPASAVNYAQAIRTAICRAWPNRHRSKTVAREVGASPRSVEDWTSGRRTPNAEQLLELMAANPEIELTIAKLIAARREARLAERRTHAVYADALGRRAAVARDNEFARQEKAIGDRRKNDPGCLSSLVLVTRRTSEQ